MFLLFFIFEFVRKYSGPDLTGTNPYHLIGIEEDTTQAIIKKAFIKYQKQKKHVPNPEPRLKDLWEKIDEAYAILGNIDTRFLYNLYSTSFINYTDFSVKDYETTENLIEGITLNTRPSNDMYKYNGLLSYPIEFELEDFFNGAERHIQSYMTTKCVCSGRENVCKKCLKTPFVEVAKEMTLKLPKGAYEHHRILSESFGENMNARGEADVVFVCTSKKHDVFERRGEDLLMNLTLSITDVLSDKKKTIIGIDGAEIELDVKGVQNYQKIVIPENGMPIFFTPAHRGNLIITCYIDMPDTLNDDQKASLSAVLPDDDSFYL